MSRVLIVRLGAIGDCIEVTPVVRKLKARGDEVVLLTSEQGMDIFQHNPNFDKLVLHKRDSVDPREFEPYFSRIAKENNCDRIIDLCESIEVRYLFHPADPQYNYSKQERFDLANKNHYDIVLELSGIKATGELPELFFSEEEENEYARFRKDLIGKFVIVWCLSGSSMHKVFPYTKHVIDTMIAQYPDIIFITVGDSFCQILEQELKHDRIINKSNKWSLRQTAIACKYASMVISPETGVLHMSGCFDVPKLGFITHTTRECVTKYFKNDLSMEAKVSCAPCFRMVDSPRIQCPIDKVTGSPWCAAFGFNPDDVIERIEGVYHGR